MVIKGRMDMDIKQELAHVNYEIIKCEVELNRLRCRREKLENALRKEASHEMHNDI